MWWKNYIREVEIQSLRRNTELQPVKNTNNPYATEVLSPYVIKYSKLRTSKKRGKQQRFSDRAIETTPYIRILFYLPLRQTEWFVTSIFQLLKHKFTVPDHTNLSRRRTIRPRIRVQQTNNQSLHLIVGSTGLSIHGEGLWSSGKKRRTGWRKLRLSIDNEGKIRSSCISKWYIIDGNRVSLLLQQIKELIASFTGDKGYNQGTVYNHILGHTSDAQIIIHPRSNTVISDKGKWNHRDKQVQNILDDGIHK